MRALDGEPTLMELAAVKDRLLACILPARPGNAAQEEALNLAALRQWRHEQELGFPGEGTPENVESFTAGTFSVRFKKNGAAGGLCPSARAALLNAGLLYRGVKAWASSE